MTDLPELQGTERQIAWATTIRDEWFDRCEQAVRTVIGEAVPGLDAWALHACEVDARDLSRKISKHPEVLRTYLEALRRQPNAHWWIDRRNSSVLDLFLDLQTELLNERRQSDQEQRLEIEAQAEATVMPENVITRLVAEISPVYGAIHVSFPVRMDEVRRVMHDLKFSWTGRLWSRSVPPGDTARDRAAEAGRRLLDAGIPIRVYDPEIREMSAAGQYRPEPTRWIHKVEAGLNTGWFRLSWPRNEDWYLVIKQISKNSRNEPGVGMVVPTADLDELLDFAESNGFALSSGAQQRVAELIAMRRLAARPEGATPGRAPGRTDKPPKLRVPEQVNVDNELRDDTD